MMRLSRTPASAAKQGQECNDESGQGLAEYALILGLIAAVCILALGGLGSAIAGSPGFTTLVSAF